MEEIVEKAIKGNDEAYEKLANLLYDDLYSFAKTKLENEEDINDAVQETLMRVYKNLKRVKKPEYMKSWAMKILINVCNDMYNAKNRKSNLIKKLQSNIEITEDTLDKFEEDFTNSDLLNKLTEIEKEIIILHYDKKRTIQEISKMLDMNENTVKSHMYRARKKLYQEKSKVKDYITKGLVIILALGIIGTGATFAKNLINEIKNKVMIFPIQSTTAIEEAVDNNYVLEVNTEFVYHNGIGIKVENITMDDKILAIDYLIHCEDTTEIEKIQLEKYIITDDENNILSVDIDTELKNKLGKRSISNTATLHYTEPIKEDLNWKMSVVSPTVSEKDYPNSNHVNIEINKILISTIDNKRKIVEGEWKFEIDLENKFNNRISEYYTYKDNEQIENITAKLNDLSLVLEIKLNDNINESIISWNNIILQDEKGKTINCISRTIDKIENTVTLVCDIGKYSNNINTLNLYMKYNYGSDKYIDVILERSN